MKHLKINFTNIFVVISLAVLCDFLWGSAFPFIKIGYGLFQIQNNETSSQLLFAGIRFMLAGAMVIGCYSIFRRKIILPSTKKTVGRICFLSLFQTILQYLFFYIGLARTTGVKGSIIEGSNVFVALIVTCLIFRLEKFTFKKLLGSIVGFSGIVLINLSGLSPDINLGDLFILTSTCAYAMSSVLLKYYSPEEDTVVLSGYQFLFGGMVLAVIGCGFGGHISRITPAGILVLFYLAFISAMAYSLWSILLAHNEVSKIVVLGFLNPMFGVILSACLLKGEASQLDWRSVLALFLVCMGITIVYSKRRKIWHS